MRQAGFTLVELIVVLVVMIIGASMAAPSMLSMLQNGRLTSDINKMVTSLNLARSEAVKRGVPVAVCSGATGGCVDGDFADGWIVFVDADNSAALSTGEEVLAVEQALNDEMTFNDSGFSGGIVSFMPNGGVRNGESGYLVLCADGALSEARAAIVNLMGRISQAPDNDGNSVPEDGAGSNIGSC